MKTLTVVELLTFPNHIETKKLRAKPKIRIEI